MKIEDQVTHFIEKHTPELTASLAAAITVGYMFQVVVVTAVSALVGAVVGHWTKVYVIPFFSRLFKLIGRKFFK